VQYPKVLACADIKGERENHKLKNGVTEHWEGPAGVFQLIKHIYINVFISEVGLGINIGDIMPFLLWA
jgi:hypothetical protein